MTGCSSSNAMTRATRMWGALKTAGKVLGIMVVGGVGAVIWRRRAE
jgi:hypothetical protein